MTKTRYRFADYSVSPSRRLLLRGDREVPLIPRYFDLLVLLLERRGEAVHRREILDAVWSDVVVSDNALNQAVRSLRRALGDDSRQPTYIRTVARHGYRFAFPDVVEEPDGAAPAAATAPPSPAPEEAPGSDPVANALDVLTAARAAPDAGEEDRLRAAAELLHRHGTARALERLGVRPGHERARALLRDVRWDVPGAEAVPLYGVPGGMRSARWLVALRWRRALRLAGGRWLGAVVGGAGAGVVAGVAGGLALRFGPGSAATNAVLIALPLVGLVIGGVGASGVGAGLTAAEALFRSRRGLALVVLAGLGGSAIGSLAHAAGALALEGLFGRDLSPVAGGFEGLVLGGALGLGYAVATPRAEGGMATPRGAARWGAAGIAGLLCGTAAASLGAAGSFLGALSLDLVAQQFPSSQVGLTPLARLLGESEPGLVTRMVVSGWEGLMFGIGVVLGVTRRPRGPRATRPPA
jgi:DNA-binding winged helix-turn-helix (wHTH) protein